MLLTPIFQDIYKNNIRDTKLCTKTRTKSQVAICMVMNDNTHNNEWQYTHKTCQLNLNDTNYHVNYHVRFDASFDIQFNIIVLVYL